MMGLIVVLRLEEERGQVTTLMSEVNSQTNWGKGKLGGRALHWARGAQRETRRPVATHIHRYGLERGDRIDYCAVVLYTGTLGQEGEGG